jgi:hypothetical protein
MFDGCRRNYMPFGSAPISADADVRWLRSGAFPLSLSRRVADYLTVPGAYISPLDGV